jgi:hypothetical protein
VHGFWKKENIVLKLSTICEFGVVNAVADFPVCWVQNLSGYHDETG